MRGRLVGTVLMIVTLLLASMGASVRAQSGTVFPPDDNGTYHTYLPMTTKSGPPSQWMTVDMHWGNGGEWSCFQRDCLITWGASQDPAGVHYAKAPSANGQSFQLPNAMAAAMATGQVVKGVFPGSGRPVFSRHDMSKPFAPNLLSIAPQGAELIPAGALVGTFWVTTEVGEALVAGAIATGGVLLIGAAVAVGVIIVGYLIYEAIQANKSRQDFLPAPGADQQEKLDRAKVWANGTAWLQAEELRDGHPMDQTLQDDVPFANPDPQDPCRPFGNFGGNFPDSQGYTLNFLLDRGVEIVQLLDSTGTVKAYAEAGWVSEGGVEYLFNHVENYDPALKRNGIANALMRVANDRAVVRSGKNPADVKIYFHDSNAFAGGYSCFKLQGDILQELDPQTWIQSYGRYFETARGYGFPDYLIDLIGNAARAVRSLFASISPKASFAI